MEVKGLFFRLVYHSLMARFFTENTEIWLDRSTPTIQDRKCIAVVP